MSENDSAFLWWSGDCRQMDATVGKDGQIFNNTTYKCKFKWRDGKWLSMPPDDKMTDKDPFPLCASAGLHYELGQLYEDRSLHHFIKASDVERMLKFDEAGVERRSLEWYGNQFACTQACSQGFVDGVSNERARTASIDRLVPEIIEALESIIAQHQSHNDAQTKHYSQPYYQDIKRDGLKYDVAVCNSLLAAEVCREVLAKLSRAVEAEK